MKYTLPTLSTADMVIDAKMELYLSSRTITTGRDIDLHKVTTDWVSSAITYDSAPNRLVQHSVLLLEAAEELIEKLHDLKDAIDFNLVKIGVIIHDVGKIKHRSEIYNTESSFHENE
jgi:HD-GYP domain-containing protein (c-di-GMP phosphodiesterase class II)